MQEIKEVLQKRQIYLQSMIRKSEKRLSIAPEGKLRISKSNNRNQFYYRKSSNDKRGTYIAKKDREFANKLAQKEYDLCVTESAKAEYSAIGQYLKHVPALFPEELYDQLSDTRKEMVIPIVETDESFIQRWTSVPYTGKPFSENDPEYLTDQGEQVRSKSEMIIANALYKYGIPYRYEYPLELDGFGTIYPDFTVLNVKHRKEIIWEHLGRMDDPEYAASNIRKILSYNRNDFYIGENLILTFETKASPINTRQITRMIEHYLLQ